MRICDLSENEIKIGLKIRSLCNPNKIGTISRREDIRNQDYWWITWDGEKEERLGFFWNDCKCELVD